MQRNTYSLKMQARPPKCGPQVITAMQYSTVNHDKVDEAGVAVTAIACMLMMAAISHIEFITCEIK